MKRAQILSDIFASVVVFFIALPLCMGIAMASGAPPARGLLTGIIGGIVAGALAGCRLQVSGPAAGLTVVVLELIQQHGLEVLGIVVAAAGALQVVAGRLKGGRLFQTVSPAVIHGMLVGIGAIIVGSQLHIMLDMKTHGSPVENFKALPNAVAQLLSADGAQHLRAAWLGGMTIATMLLWRWLKLNKLTRLPEALPAIVLVTVVATIIGGVNRVDVPETVSELVSPVSFSNFRLLADPALIQAVLTLAFVQSAESMLGAASVDQLTGKRSNYSKELEAQGWANFLSGMLGGLPLTGVIVRSKVNIEAGAKTPLSAILHGFWLLAAVALLPQILELIPTCGLAALLVLTGWKLMDWKILATLKKFGWGEVVIFLTTSGLIVAQDLLTGVLVGIALALARVAFLLVTNCKVTLVQTGDNINLDIAGVASFVMKWKLASVLDKIPDGTRVTLTFNNLDFLDHASLEFLETWTTQHEQAGGQVVYDRDSLALKARQKVTKSDTAPAEIPQT